MSMDKSFYIVAGYDLTDFTTDKYEDWKWTEEGEEFFCYQREGEVQLFDNQDLYLGYILFVGDEYEFKTKKFDVIDIGDILESVKSNVDNKLFELIEQKVISQRIGSLKYKIIVFEECS